MTWLLPVRTHNVYSVKFSVKFCNYSVDFEYIFQWSSLFRSTLPIPVQIFVCVIIKLILSIDIKKYFAKFFYIHIFFSGRIKREHYEFQSDLFPFKTVVKYFLRFFACV